jgi:transposase
MYKPYISLVKEIFPQANIIMDKFHILNNLSIALNKAIKRISFGYRSFF